MAAATRMGPIHIQFRPPIGWEPKMSRNQPTFAVKASSAAPPMAMGRAMPKRMLAALPTTLSASTWSAKTCLQIRPTPR